MSSGPGILGLNPHFDCSVIADSKSFSSSPVVASRASLVCRSCTPMTWMPTDYVSTRHARKASNKACRLLTIALVNRGRRACGDSQLQRGLPHCHAWVHTATQVVIQRKVSHIDVAFECSIVPTRSDCPQDRSVPSGAYGARQRHCHISDGPL